MSEFMKFISIIVFCFLFSLNSQSQDFAEKGSVWHYTLHHSRTPPWQDTYITIESNKDTLFQSQKCHQLEFIMKPENLFTPKKLW